MIGKYLDCVVKITSSKWYLIVLTIVLLFEFFMHKILSNYMINEIKKILNSKFEIVNLLIKEELEKELLHKKYENAYNFRCKAVMYCTLFMASTLQLIDFLYINENSININVLMFTIVIALMEWRDNRSSSNEIFKEIEQIEQNIISINTSCEELASQDLVLDNLEKRNFITKEKRIELIKRINSKHI